MYKGHNFVALVALVFMLFGFLVQPATASSLQQVVDTGVLRHLGIPYANFVTEKGKGLDVEVMKRFAKHLGVRYEFVESNWMRIFGDLTGEYVRFTGDEVHVVGHKEVRGDVIATGLTVLEWRKKIVCFSTPTFPTQVWSIAKEDFPADPIIQSGDVKIDLSAVKLLMKGHSVLGKDSTCLDHSLYGIDSSVSKVMHFPGKLNDMVPAILKGVAEVTLLDVPDMLVALDLYPGKLKVLGPVSGKQRMAAAFRKDSPELLNEFNTFFRKLNESGEYRALVEKYYPEVFNFYPEFFE